MKSVLSFLASLFLPLLTFGGDVYFPGVNLSGGEFGSGPILEHDFTYPVANEFTYFHGKGMKIIRLPFKWERLQPQLSGELDPTNLKEIDRCIATASQLGLLVLLDVHNYSQRTVDGKVALLGVDPRLTNEQFNDFWMRLARRYQSNPLVWFGLMNEPHEQTARENAATMQSVVTAIRGTGAKNKILVPGTSWTGAHSWIESGNAAALENFDDTANNFAFEVHQYLDQDSSGTHPEVVTGIGKTVLVAFTEWARAHHFKAFLGETGWDDKPANTQANIEGDALLGYMDQNRDVWLGYTIWSAGPWWGPYMFSVEPTGLGQSTPVDKNQMQILLKHQ